MPTMNLTEKWPALRLPIVAREPPVDDERLLKLFRNRAELKKELQGLDDELHNLRNRIKQQEGANSRLQEQIEQLEVALGTAERGPGLLVHFGLRNLWRECRAQLDNFAGDLRRQRQDHERKRQLAEFQNDQKERLKLAEERLLESKAVVESERARLADGQRRLQSLNAFWHYFRRREQTFELEAQRARLADAERQLADMKQAQRTIEKEPWPEFGGLSVQGRRAINLAVIAYAQLLVSRLAGIGLASEARLATHRRVQDVRPAARAECFAELDKIARGTTMVKDQAGIAPEIRAITERLKGAVTWRSQDDVVPTPSSLPSLAADGQGGNVLIDDYWDLHSILAR
jgi:hypothetical protein